MDSKEYNKERYKDKRVKEMVKDNKKRFVSKNKELGLCSYCTTPCIEHSNTYCEEHFFKQKSAYHFNTEKYAKDLKELLEKQDYLCPYTGEVLVIGLNAGIDHVLPQKRYPELSKDINNIQWISKRINLIKNDLTHDELIELAYKITSKYPIL